MARAIKNNPHNAADCKYVIEERRIRWEADQMKDDSRWFFRSSGRWKFLPDPRFDSVPESFYSAGSPDCLKSVELSEAYLAELPEPPLPNGLAGVMLFAYCECGSVMARADDGEWVATKTSIGYEWSRRASHDNTAFQAEHGHYEDFDASNIRFYTLGPTGHWKNEERGTTADIILAASGFASYEGPVPPLSVINEMLAKGVWDAGMSGGVEFPPHQVEPADYEALRRELLERANALHDLVLPADLTNHEQLQTWWWDHLDQFPSSAHEAWKEQAQAIQRRKPKTEADQEELARHLRNRLGFLTAFTEG